jgi:hypothetical protein
MSIYRRCSGSIWRSSALLGLLAIAGCGGLQPASWMEQDEAYVVAVPDEARSRVGKPRALDVRADGDTAVTLQLLDPVVDALNGMTLQLLGVLDEIVSVPPDERTEDSRRWGPHYVSDVDLTYQLDVQLEDAQYRYEVLLDAGDTGAATYPVMIGDYQPSGDTTGAGTFDLDGAVLQAMLPVSGVTGTLVVDHEIDASSLRIGMDLRGLQADDLDDLLVPDRYTYSEGADVGQLCFLATVDWTAGEATEQLQVVARWDLDGGGRADGSLSGGDLASPIEIVECWDGQGVATYWWDSAGLFPTSGDPSACPAQAADLPATCDEL